MSLYPVQDPNSTKYPDRVFFWGYWCTPTQVEAARIRHRKQQARWSEERRQRQRDASRKYQREKGRYSKYGITKADYEQLLAVQEGRCKTCARPAADSRGGTLVIDHDHRTDRVRALLCHNCNVVLGLVNDSAEVLRALITLCGGEEIESSA